MALSRRARLVFSLIVLAIGGVLPALATTTIPEGDLNPLSAPCTLSLSESNQQRVLTWAPVSGAARYKVGFIRRLEIVGLAETFTTTYTHTGFDPGDCLDYVVVAYDGAGHPVCAARMPRVGRCP